jgi:hypothetical protein
VVAKVARNAHTAKSERFENKKLFDAHIGLDHGTTRIGQEICVWKDTTRMISSERGEK